jgi:pimeloyl-ACP methyl ester carboxylesterase
MRATDPAARIGSLLTNPGGPGSAGLDKLATIFAPNLEKTDVGKRFDLVGFDPRGVGASKPTIDCLTDAERDQLRLEYVGDSSPAGVAKSEANSQGIVAKCVQRTGVDVLANVGTRDVVKDMDILRAVLGDSQLSYLGYSYGTQIGYTYAEAFPANVRAMVLDGAVDPDQSRIDEIVAQSAGFQHAFDAFVAWCVQRQCPLGQRPEQAVAAFQALTRPLIDKPAQTRDGRLLSYPDAVTAVNQALYLDDLWEPLRRGLAALAARDGTILKLLADLYEDRGPDGRYTNTLEAFVVIGCVDEQAVKDPAQALELDRKAREVAPFRDDGRGASAARDPCAFWPVPPTSQPHRPAVNGLAPVVVVSVTGDPATPYQAGVNLSQELGGRLLSAEGNQHTVAFRGVACVDEPLVRYLVDLTLPPEGAQCRI